MQSIVVITKDSPKAADELHALDFQHMPVVQAEAHQPWSEFRLDTTAEL